MACHQMTAPPTWQFQSSRHHWLKWIFDEQWPLGLSIGWESYHPVKEKRHCVVSLSHASPVLSFKQLTKSFRLGPLHLKWCVITSGEILSKGHKWFWKVILFKPYVQLNATKKKKGCGYKTMTPRTAFLWVTQDSRIIGAFFGWDV